MGKKGDLLRAAKNQNTTYTFTKAQLEDHDRQVRDEYIKKIDALVKKRAREADQAREAELREHVNALWKFNGKELLAYHMAISCRVLIEQFGWTPPRARGRNTKIMKYAAALAEETDKIMYTDSTTLREYVDETDRLYGINFRSHEVEDEHDGDN